MFTAKAKFISFSPYKLRPLLDVIRGKNAQFALNWLATYNTRRTSPVEKVLKSALANAHQLGGYQPEQLMIKLFTADQGPILKYFKPGAMGRANIQRRRFSHLNIKLEHRKEA